MPTALTALWFSFAVKTSYVVLNAFPTELVVDSAPRGRFARPEDLDVEVMGVAVGARLGGMAAYMRSDGQTVTAVYFTEEAFRI